MRILITGASGFIGKRLCARLEQLGHSLFRYDVAQGDLTRADALDHMPDVDFVYHLAARTFVPASWDESHSFYQNNVMGSVTVLEYCRKKKIPLLLMSTYMYGNPKYLPVDEGHPLVAPSPYHESKLICESLCSFYAEHYGMSIRVFRPFNVYGAGQNEAFLLPKIMKQILSADSTEIKVFDLAPKRDYIYIDDLIAALICIQKPWAGLETFNVGTGASISVKEVIETMLRVTGSSKGYCATNEARGSEINDCYADMSKAKDILGFEPRVSLAQGVENWLAEIR